MDRSKYLLPDRWWPAWPGLIIHSPYQVVAPVTRPNIYSLYQVVDSIGKQGGGA